LPQGDAAAIVNLSGITPPSEQPVLGPGYSVAFNVTPNSQGVVQGTVNPTHSTPVASATNGSPLYMTAGFGSPLTADIASSGAYLSTGFGTITLTFLQPETSFGLLWGSVDSGNLITFDDVSKFSLTGAQVKGAASTFLPSGSIYVVVNTATPFKTVTASSTTGSFEFTDVVAANAPLVTVAGEPPTALILGAGSLLTLSVFHIHRKLA
jgi:hypothetical protein